jgi:conflict system pore-forming effector with SLATT domain
MAPATYKPAPDLRIPVEVRIGIIGRWTPEQKDRVGASVRKVRRELAKALNHSPATYALLPGLAEGADSLMSDQEPAQTASASSSGLPAAVLHYLESFKTERSKKKFRDQFRDLAKRSKEAPDPILARAKEIVQDCNVVIAIWNPVQGFDDSSAAPLIAFALQSGRTFYWIDPADGRTKRYDNDDCFLDSIVNKDAYNGASVDAEELAADLNAQVQALEAQAFAAHIRPGSLDALFPRVLPHFVRAEALAAHWRNRYVWLGKAIYSLAALAVATGTVVSIFDWSRTWAFWEVGETAAVLMLVCISELGDVLQRWIDYRFLAERLRAAIHLYVAGVSSVTPSAGRSMRWMLDALQSICECPMPQQGQNDLEAVKQFTRNGWVLAQRDWYVLRGGELNTKHQITLTVSATFFVFAAVAALFHASGWFEPLKPYWEAAAIILPAAGASMAGYRAYRGYRPTSLQYAGMAEALTQTAVDLDNTTKPEALTRLLADTLETFNREHQGWRVLVHVHEPSDTI